MLSIVSYLFVWCIVTVLAFSLAKIHNRDCHEVFKVTWEPWVISASVFIILVL